MPDNTPRDAVSMLLPPVLTALESLEVIGRRLHPPDLPALVEGASGIAASVREELEAVRADTAPGPSAEPEAGLVAAAAHVCLAFDALAEAARDPKAFVQAYRAMRENTCALEALYPLAASLPEVSQFFIEPALRESDALAMRLARADTHRSEQAGIIHVDNDRERRGGFSMYVPEYYDPAEAYPLIVALHGGSGHGADFLWSWLRDARSRGAILIAPTSRERTWSLQHPEVDGPRIDVIVKQVEQSWHINQEKMLLTGMSDGATFTLITGLRANSLFTHLAPCSASFHPTLVERSSAGRLAGLPVYLMHGVLDWMFPVDFARIANAALTRAGAAVLYREIDDLSHTYPQDENPRIMDWFLGPAR
jgi:phospholipase/carboxylesterase